MKYLMIISIIAVGLYITRLGYKRHRVLVEYEFNNRTDGGVVQYASLGEWEKRHRLKGLWSFVCGFGALILVFGLLMLALVMNT